MATRTALLRTIPVFGTLADEDLAHISSLTREKTYGRGEQIFTEGERIQAIYFILSGMVKVFTLTPDGREQTLNLLRPGDFFPLMGFAPGGRYPANAQALEDCRTLIIRQDDLLQALGENRELCLQVLAVMACQFTLLQQRLRDMSQRYLRARVGRALLWLAESHGEPTAEGIRLNLHLTHQDISNLVGAARESVSRAMGDLKRDGLIGIAANGALVIRDKEGLLTLNLQEQSP